MAFIPAGMKKYFDFQEKRADPNSRETVRTIEILTDIDRLHKNRVFREVLTILQVPSHGGSHWFESSTAQYINGDAELRLATCK